VKKRDFVEHLVSPDEALLSYMRLALRLAWRGCGTISPNPIAA
jgi:pyrimidine deaminase RibD-like protein